MFDPVSLRTTELAGLIGALARLEQEVDDAERIDRIRLLEELKSAVAAAQVRESAAFAAAQQAAAQGGPGEKHLRRSVAGQVGLARRVSPWQAGRYVGWAKVLTTELPHTFAALQSGRVSEWRALLVAKETIWLSRERRAVVDRELAPRLESLGDREIEAAAKKIGYRLDPQGFLARSRAAESDRHVSIRPAPDTMTRLTALLPVAQGVAVFAALSRHADTHLSDGDPRGRGQIMADTLVERVTGHPSADATPVEIQLLMTERTLLDADSPEPAQLDGYGPIPAGLARQLALHHDAPRWIRRLFTHPRSGQLIAMDRHRRHFSAGQRRFVRNRDQHCRTPYCAAPIRHTDHIDPAHTGGATTVPNARGTCETCNYTKQAPGWRTRVLPTDDGHEVETTTPTGHRYHSRAPDPPGQHRKLVIYADIRYAA